MKKRLLSILLAVLLTVSLLPAAFAAETEDSAELAGKTVILHSNDVHGNLEGYACIAALKAEYEAKGAEVILVDAGDYSQGTPYVSASSGETAVTMMNAVGYDIVTVGNHEFDYGFEQLVENLKKAEFKVVCANIQRDGKSVFEPGAVYTTDSGVKIGFFGLDTPEVKTKVIPAYVQGLTFLNDEALYACAQKQVDILKESADIVICLSHLGVDEESYGHRSYDLFANTEGIDMILDAHSHVVCTEGKNGEPIQSTGTKFENIGVVIIDDETKTIESNGLTAVTEGSARDEAVAAFTKSITDPIDAKYNEIFAFSEVALNGAKAGPGNRDSETNSGDLITDALRWEVLRNKGSVAVEDDHVVAVANGGGVRTAIAPGDVTMADINTVLPFGNTVTVIYVTGAELLEALEASSFCTPEPVGGFPQVAGIDMTIDTTKAFDANAEPYPGSGYYGPGSIRRVTVNSINGLPFSLTDTYAVVTNNFCSAGGDTYYAFAAASGGFDTGVPMDEAVMDYIRLELNGVIGERYAEPQGRIRIIVNPFADVKNTDWFAPYVVGLYNDGVVSGVSATAYDPAGTMTWSAALKLLLVSSGELAAADAVGADWSKNTVARASELGLVAAELDGSQPITRVEFCRIAARLNNIAESASASVFSDCSDGYVTALAELAVVSGMGDGTFAPDASINRAQGAKIVFCLGEAT